MDFHRLEISDVALVVPEKFEDGRGWFTESYNARKLKDFGIGITFVQDNQAYSCMPGTLRGLHFQHPPFSQSKLVRVLSGAIYDVAVDLRRSSSSYGKFVSAVLSSANRRQLLIPSGFAHGYCTIEPDTEVLYKVDAPYAPEAEDGIIWSDTQLGISWPVDVTSVSEKDQQLGRLRDFKTPF